MTGDLDVNNSPVTLKHPGRGLARIEVRTLDRALHIQAGAGTVLKRIAVSGGEADDGGGILTLAPLRLVRSSVRGNTATNDGGGIDAQEVSPVRLIKSQVRNNFADDGGGALNRAAVNGGGLSIADATQPVSSIVNSTVAGNRAVQNGGGIYAAESADVNLNAVTVARNIASSNSPGPPPSTGGGIYMIDSIFEVRNSLIALNEVGQGGLVANDCEGETFTSLGSNLLSTKVECDGFTQPTDLERANPKLGTLRKNGGPTKTIELKRGSAAIGNAHKPSAPNRDQRGRKRDNRPDIGAF